MTIPKIYIADLAAYNDAILYGVWIDATKSLEELQQAVECLLDDSPIMNAEEFAIHDYEGFNGYSVSEHQSLESVHFVACFIQEYPAFGGELLNYYSDLDEASEAAEHRYCGCYSSLADYAQELTEERCEIPESLRNYIDYEAMARDMDMGGDTLCIEVCVDQVHIFYLH